MSLMKRRTNVDDLGCECRCDTCHLRIFKYQFSIKNIFKNPYQSISGMGTPSNEQ